MEDIFNDTMLELREIKSSLLILQKAISNENEYDTISYEDIDNNLEILIDKMDKVIEKMCKIHCVAIKVNNTSLPS